MGVITKVDVGLEASLATTFDVLSWEMELAGARCMMVDAVIGEVMASLPDDKRARLLEGMHAVDLLSQQLTSLGAFTRKMSGSVGHEMCAPVDEALRDITLGALADRMLTAFGGEGRDINDGDGAGDLDLF
ncbi:MAG TPA: hypothetical protein VIO94_17970 [Phenylobacterium sp.]